MLVEDNEVTREAMPDVLESLDYEVLEAANGEEALALFADHAGDVALVLSDMVMPSMGGTKLLERMAEIDPHVRVVMMTGYPLEESGQELLGQGVVAWLQKPFDVDQLLAVLGDVLG